MQSDGPAVRCEPVEGAGISAGVSGVYRGDAQCPRTSVQVHSTVSDDIHGMCRILHKLTLAMCSVCENWHLELWEFVWRKKQNSLRYMELGPDATVSEGKLDEL